MKTVFTGREVPHIFAAQTQTRGRNSNDSLWFEGKTLYSYREPIARFFGDVVLMSAGSFSVTTSKHQSWAWGAVRHFETVRVPSLKRVCEILDYKREREAMEYIKARMAEIADLEESLPRKRSEWKIQEARGRIAMLENACALVWAAVGKRSDWRKRAAPELEKKMRAERKARYERALGGVQYMAERGAADRIAEMRARFEENAHGVRNALFILENAANAILRGDELGARHGDGVTATWADAQKLMSKAFAAEYRAHVETLEAMAAPIFQEANALRADLDKLERAENAEKLEKWLSGENVAPPRMTEIYFRVIGEEVQTSQGARVPLPDAIRVVRMAARCRDENSTLQRETFATGPYRGISIDARGNVRIGCHSFTWRGISEAVCRFVPDLAWELESAAPAEC